MTAKHRLCGVISFSVYGLVACLLTFFLLIDNTELAIILSPALPLILLARNTSRLEFIYDFRLVYLSSIFVWSFGKSLSVLMSYGHSGVRGESVEVYMSAMVLAPALALFFSVPPASYFARVQISRRDTRMLIFAAVVWFLSTFILYVSLAGLVNDPIAFVLKHLSQSFALVFASIVVMLLYRRWSVQSVCLILAVTVLTVFTYLQSALNRTSLLLPGMVLAAAVFFQSNLLAERIQSAKAIFASIIIVPLLSLLLIMGDLQKQVGLSLPAAVEYAISYPEIALNVIKSSNYLPSDRSASDYFNSVSAVLESKQNMLGGLLYQLVSSVTPRIFFPDKVDTDISQIMWEQGLLPQILYYEIYLEPIIDSGVFGVAIYYTLFLFLVWISWVSVMENQKGFHGIYSRSVYILNLVVLFMIIRGPVIFVVWYALLPNLVVWWWLLIKRLRSFGHAFS